MPTTTTQTVDCPCCLVPDCFPGGSSRRMWFVLDGGSCFGLTSGVPYPLDWVGTCDWDYIDENVVFQFEGASGAGANIFISRFSGSGKFITGGIAWPFSSPNTDDPVYLEFASLSQSGTGTDFCTTMPTKITVYED